MSYLNSKYNTIVHLRKIYYIFNKKNKKILSFIICVRDSTILFNTILFLFFILYSVHIWAYENILKLKDNKIIVINNNYLKICCLILTKSYVKKIYVQKC